MLSMMMNKLAPVSFGLVLFLACTAQAALDPFFYSAPFSQGICPTGSNQSPINIDSASTVSLPTAKRTSSLTFPVASGVTILNTGKSLQVEWTGLKAVGRDTPVMPISNDGGIAAVLSRRARVSGSVRVVPLQFHFHSISEHTINNIPGVAEAHIVCAVEGGAKPEWGCNDPEHPEFANNCLAVFGVVYKLGASSPAYLDTLFDNASSEAEGVVPYPGGTIDISTILPAKKDYWTYQGSLTTPDCNELVRWTVFKEQVPITVATWAKMQYYMSQTRNSTSGVQNGYRNNNRFPQPLNGRTVWDVTN